jgi:Ca2+-binding EF-hand superfamily protein
MGCSGSVVRAKFIPNIAKPGQGKEVTVICEYLGLQEADLNHLFDEFNKTDDDGSGKVSVAELKVRFRLNNDLLVSALFLLCDHEKTGQVDFLSFLITMWSYLT